MPEEFRSTSKIHYHPKNRHHRQKYLLSSSTVNVNINKVIILHYVTYCTDLSIVDIFATTYLQCSINQLLR